MAYTPPETPQVATGSLTALNQAVTFTLNGEANATFGISGTWVGQLTFEASNNGFTASTTILATRTGDNAISPVIDQNFNNDIYRCTVAGFSQVRVRCSAYTSGTIVVNANTSFNTSGVFFNFPLPESKNKIGVVDLAPEYQDIYNHSIVAQRLLQLNYTFASIPPASLLLITGTGTATQGNGEAVFSSGTGVSNTLTARTPLTLNYTPQYELFSSFSARFTAPTSAASSQRLGAYSAVDGLSFGYNGLTFGLWYRFNSIDTFVSQAAWNIDNCQGGLTSDFIRVTTPESLDPTKTNIYRVRYGWHGAAPLIYEILNPNGQYIPVHIIRPANSLTTPSMINPNVPITLEITKTASDATNLVVSCPAWSGGTSAPNATSFVGYGTIAAISQAVLMPAAGVSGLAIRVSGTWVGTLTFQSTIDGITWDDDLAYSATTTTLTSTTSTNGSFETNVAAYRGYRVIAAAFTSGTATITYSASQDSTISTVQALLPTLTKGVQSASGISTQDLKDAGRNPVHYYHVIPVLSTATDTLQSLTGTKAGVTVAATTTPAVVSAAKTMRITRLAATYIATATSGYGIVRLRFNTAGVVVIGSPVAATLAIGADTPATANSSGYEEATLSDGWEFAAGTGIGISVQGFAAVTAAAVGYLLVSVTGFEY